MILIPRAMLSTFILLDRSIDCAKCHATIQDGLIFRLRLKAYFKRWLDPQSLSTHI